MPSHEATDTVGGIELKAEALPGRPSREGRIIEVYERYVRDNPGRAESLLDSCREATDRHRPARLTRDLTREQAAERIGLTVSTIRQLVSWRFGARVEGELRFSEAECDYHRRFYSRPCNREIQPTLEERISLAPDPEERRGLVNEQVYQIVRLVKEYASRHRQNAIQLKAYCAAALKHVPDAKGVADRARLWPEPASRLGEAELKEIELRAENLLKRPAREGRIIEVYEKYVRDNPERAEGLLDSCREATDRHRPARLTRTLTREQAAERTGLTVNTFTGLASQGRLGAWVVGKLRFSEAECDHYRKYHSKLRDRQPDPEVHQRELRAVSLEELDQIVRLVGECADRHPENASRLKTDCADALRNVF